MLDPVGGTHRNDDDYRQAIRMNKIFFYKDVSWFYGGLMLLSIALGPFFILFP